MSQTPEKTPTSSPIAPDGTCEFFVVVTPGFESLAQKEINFWRQTPSFASIGEPLRERGGLSFRAPLVAGCHLNRVVKIPTRILLRLTAFGCRDFPKLFKKTAGFPWCDWVDGAADFQASTHKSRLFIKKRIEETCRDGFKKALKARAETIGAGAGRESASGPQQILVRFDDDVCTFSLDTSGELLHKRGTKVLSSEAPLRETIAAAMLMWMSSEGPAPRGAVTLIDPMVGSGTFAIEASHLERPLANRAFSFERFPIYRAQIAVAPLPALEARISPVRFDEFIGFDIDRKAAETTKQNWRDLGETRVFDIHVQDVFDSKPLPASEGERWLIANPPYGERLKVEGRLRDYYELLFETCERVVRPTRSCFVLPDTAKPPSLRAPKRWGSPQILKFQNGGLPVTALLFTSAAL